MVGYSYFSEQLLRNQSLQKSISILFLPPSDSSGGIQGWKQMHYWTHVLDCGVNFVTWAVLRLKLVVGNVHK